MQTYLFFLNILIKFPRYYSLKAYVIEKIDSEHFSPKKLPASEATVCAIDPNYKIDESNFGVIICSSDAKVIEYSEGYLIKSFLITA